jgi:hypothetical protein
MSKWIITILSALLIGTNGFWLYSFVDRMVTEKYRQQEEYERETRLKALTKLNNHFVNGMRKEELAKILKHLFPETEPFEKEGNLNSLWLSFKVNGNGKIDATK